MTRTLTKVWWLFALGGLFDLIQSAIHLLMLNLDAALTLRRFAAPNTVWDIGLLALAAGACAIASALWTAGKNNTWLLALHGIALSVFGAIAISPLVRGPISFRPISQFLTITAASIGAFVLLIARETRSPTSQNWLPQQGGFIANTLALYFLIAGLGWVSLWQPHGFWILMSSYFGLSAILKLWLAAHLHALPPDPPHVK